ncbi:hypothetical protein BC835DRAFT_964633 [Cytidiella melzeri]|nr:hypothetical protein BC835DRAFT_964633 [Cytidiella melzeri]
MLNTFVVLFALHVFQTTITLTLFSLPPPLCVFQPERGSWAWTLHCYFLSFCCFLNRERERETCISHHSILINRHTHVTWPRHTFVLVSSLACDMNILKTECTRLYCSISIVVLVGLYAGCATGVLDLRCVEEFAANLGKRKMEQRERAKAGSWEDTGRVSLCSRGMLVRCIESKERCTSFVRCQLNSLSWEGGYPGYGYC